MEAMDNLYPNEIGGKMLPRKQINNSLYWDEMVVNQGRTGGCCPFSVCLALMYESGQELMPNYLLKTAWLREGKEDSEEAYMKGYALKTIVDIAREEGTYPLHIDKHMTTCFFGNYADAPNIPVKFRQFHTRVQEEQNQQLMNDLRLYAHSNDPNFEIKFFSGTGLVYFKIDKPKDQYQKRAENQPPQNLSWLFKEENGEYYAPFVDANRLAQTSFYFPNNTSKISFNFSLPVTNSFPSNEVLQRMTKGELINFIESIRLEDLILDTGRTINLKSNVNNIKRMLNVHQSPIMVAVNSSFYSKRANKRVTSLQEHLRPLSRQNSRIIQRQSHSDEIEPDDAARLLNGGYADPLDFEIKFTHALIVFGYNDTKKEIYIKNTWGDGTWAWREGDQIETRGGIAALTYRFVNRHLCSDMYVVKGSKVQNN